MGKDDNSTKQWEKSEVSYLQNRRTNKCKTLREDGHRRETIYGVTKRATR